MASVVKSSVLIIEDEEDTRAIVTAILEPHFKVVSSPDGKDGLQKIRKSKFDTVLLDIGLPGMDGIKVLRLIRKIDETLNVVMFTATSEVKTVVRAMKMGAYDYIAKPFMNDDLLACLKRATNNGHLRREVEHLRSEVLSNYDFRNMVANSPAMQPVLDRIDRVKDSDASVLIIGESGTGKELVARAIHYGGDRRNGPFVGLNCACYPQALLDNELFGHEKGAFTGAIARQEGKFEQAHGGTLFLDEITAMSPGAQAKLLRVLDQKTVQRLGGAGEVEVDARVISATSRNCDEAISEGLFREELYYRLNVVSIEVPPLRERKEDIPDLVDYFLHRYFKRTGRKFDGVTELAMECLLKNDWKGNIRQLENVIEQCAILEEGTMVTECYLPNQVLRACKSIVVSAPRGGGLKKSIEETEKHLILSCLESSGWHVSEAAKKLRIHRNTLRDKMKKYRIRPKSPQRP